MGLGHVQHVPGPYALPHMPLDEAPAARCHVNGVDHETFPEIWIEIR
jgi:hypothetical protein